MKLLSLLALVSSGFAFSVQNTKWQFRVATATTTPFQRARDVLYALPEDGDEAEVSSVDLSSSEIPLPTTSSDQSEESSYPIDLPSPLLLSGSMVLAIAGIGSLFDLSGGDPNLGFGPTAGIAAVAVPTSLFLFYASILKATAETEADDREFMKGN